MSIELLPTKKELVSKKLMPSERNHLSNDDKLLAIARRDRDIGLVLDFDGTLIDIANHPDEVFVPDDLPHLLMNLYQYYHGSVAILTGRKASSIQTRLPALPCLIVGQHGAEFPASSQTYLDRHIMQNFYRDTLLWEKQFPGLYIEMKGFSIAYHYRANLAIVAELEIALKALLDKNEYSNFLTMTKGRAVLEITFKGIDKGSTISAIANTAPFLGKRLIYAGDDEPDKKAILHVKNRGGIGIWIGEPIEGMDYIFPTPADFRAWLSQLLKG